MKTSVSVVLGVTLVLFAVCGEVCALEGGTSSSKQTSPLSQAADEFKVLTRDLGMRPESPPNAQEQPRPQNALARADLRKLPQ